MSNYGHRLTAVLALSVGLDGIAGAQTGGFTRGGGEIYTSDFSKTAVGQFPEEFRLLSGRAQVVEKDGVRMLRASEPMEFLIRLKDKLPEAFTLEFDIIPKSGGAPEDISFEGTASISRSETSAHVTMNSTAIFVVGGKSGDDQTFWMATPTELAETMPEAMTHFGVSIDANGIDLYANNRLLTSLGGRRFARGQVLRVLLGGGDGGPVYLGRLRIGAGGTPPTLAGNNTGPSWQTPSSTGTPATSNTVGGSTNTQTEPRSAFQVTVTMGSSGPLVSWPVVPDAGGYSVSRQKIGDVCCNNDSGRGYLTASPWQDKQLPSSGTYSYLVLANTPAGLVRAETQFSYTSSTGTTGGSGSTTTSTGTGTTVVGGSAATQRAVTDMTGTPSGGSGSTTTSTGTGTTVVGGSTATQRAVTDMTGTPSGGTGDVPAKYRVTLTGFRVAKPTSEPIVADDGRFDEAYASAAVVVFNRKDLTVASHTVVRTREYGDVGSGKFGDRIKAGTATPYGGIWSPPGGDPVPAEYDPSGSTFPDPQTDRFPLMLWEGSLNVGVEALLVVPTIWDRDLDSATYEAWKNPWITGSLTRFVSLTEVVNETKTAGVVPIVADALAGLPFVLPMPEATGHIKDRPIGVQLDPPSPLPPIGIIYKDRHVMLTREKLADLAPGAAKMISVPFGEQPLAPVTGAMYTLYLRIQRIQ